MDICNIADLLGVLFLGYGIIDGYRKGFVKKGTSLVLTLVTLLLVYMASPYVETFMSGILPDALNLEQFTGTDSELYRILVLSGLGEKIEGGIQTLAARVLAWVATYVVVRILLRTLMMSLEILVKVPGLSLLNRISGAALGFLQQLLAVWLFFLVIVIFSSTSWGSAIYRLVQDSSYMIWLYENNLLLLLGILLIVGV